MRKGKIVVDLFSFEDLPELCENRAIATMSGTLSIDIGDVAHKLTDQPNIHFFDQRGNYYHPDEIEVVPEPEPQYIEVFIRWVDKDSGRKFNLSAQALSRFREFRFYWAMSEGIDITRARESKKMTCECEKLVKWLESFKMPHWNDPASGFDTALRWFFSKPTEQTKPNPFAKNAPLNELE